MRMRLGAKLVAVTLITLGITVAIEQYLQGRDKPARGVSSNPPAAVASPAPPQSVPVVPAPTPAAEPIAPATVDAGVGAILKGRN